jgi:hypothetical protein
MQLHDAVFLGGVSIGGFGFSLLSIVHRQQSAVPDQQLHIRRSDQSFLLHRHGDGHLRLSMD